jgi:WD40 repeat protein
MNARRALRVCASLISLLATLVAAPGQSLRLVPETGHSSLVNSAAFSPDGKTLASGNDDKTIKLWNVASGKEIRTLAGHTGSVYSVAFSPDGKTLASGSWDNTIKLWDAASGKEIRTLAGHTGWVYSVAYSPDGKTLASGSNDTTIKLWDVASGNEIRTLAGHTDLINFVAFSPDGRCLATGSRDNAIKLWETASGKEIRTLAGHADSVRSVAFAPDGKTLASGSDDKTIKLWDAASGKEIKTLDGDTSSVHSVAFSPDGKTLASGSADNTVKLWDVARGKELRTLTGHAGPVNSVAFSSDGKTLASGSEDKTVKLWDVASGKVIRTLAGHAVLVFSVAFSPDGKTLAIGNVDHTIRLWDLSSGREIKTLVGHADYILSLAFSPNGKTIASGSWDNTVKLWNVASGKEIRTLAGHIGFVDSVAFSPSGKSLVSGGLDSSIILWDAASGKEIRTLPGHAGPVSSLAFSLDGKTLASGGDKSIELWDAATGKMLRTLAGHVGAVSSLAFSRNGKTLASGSDDNTLKLWDVASGKAIRTLAGHTNAIRSVTFSPDGKTLASGSNDNSVKLWDAASGKEIRTLAGHAGSVLSVAFSQDGQTLATGNDGGIDFWNVPAGSELYLQVPFNDGSSIALAPDGRYDSSDGPRPHFGHFVMDLPGQMPEVVDFDQIRTKDYYEPDLVSKIMSGSYKPGEEPLLSQKPAPSVEHLVTGNLVKFRVTERDGGGIGEVRITVNGQGVKSFPEGGIKSGVWMSWDGKGQLAPGAQVDVVADNGKETLASPRGRILNSAAPNTNAPIRFVGVAMGVKNYLGGIAHLQYAGADAVSMVRAMLTLAKSLGTNVKPELYLLTDETVPDDLKSSVTVMPPNKASYDSVYATLKATKFTPNTLLFLDFSGHGAMVGDEYVYLTKDNRSADPNELKNELGSGVSMNEILSFLNLDLTGKRLLVLDTCQAAGAEKVLAANLKEGEAERDAQTRTLTDWQNRYAVGTQVLMGCPQDAPSFEDPRYGHGLLTYSLLYCLRNSDLGDHPGDPEVFANRLVEESARQTKEFASELGLSQDALPLGANRFPIGIMSREDRLTKIVLPNPKPAIWTCFLTDDADLPATEFNQAFIARLESASKGGTVVHIASTQAPGVWTLSGRFLKAVDGKVMLKLHLTCPGQAPATLSPITTTAADAVADAYRAISEWFRAHNPPGHT